MLRPPALLPPDVAAVVKAAAILHATHVRLLVQFLPQEYPGQARELAETLIGEFERVLTTPNATPLQPDTPVDPPARGLSVDAIIDAVLDRLKTRRRGEWVRYRDLRPEIGACDGRDWSRAIQSLARDGTIRIASHGNSASYQLR